MLSQQDRDNPATITTEQQQANSTVFSKRELVVASYSAWKQMAELD